MWFEWDCTCITDWSLFMRACFKKETRCSALWKQSSGRCHRKNRVESRRRCLGSLVFSESDWVKGAQRRRSSLSKVLILKTATIVRRMVLQESQFKDWQKFSLIKVERGDPLVEVRSLSKDQATFHSFSTETFASSRRSQECLKIKQKTAFLVSIIK